MKTASNVLGLLYDRGEGYWSLNDLMREADLDPVRLNAILAELGERGLELDLSPAHGVRLNRPTPLDADLIERDLAVRRVGRHVIVFDEVDSTSDVAADSARQSGADGLTVLALSTTDPTSLIENMMSGMGEMASQFKVDSDIADVKILLEDGTEIPAKVVLRDKDLDLAYVRPLEAPGAPLPVIDLAGSAEPAILDPVITLNRLGKVAGRTCAVSIERIQAIIRKPRIFYVPGNDPTHSGAGSPVFTTDGKVVGMIAVRTIKTEGGGGFAGMFGGGMGQGMIAVVVPAEDIREGAQQAPLAADTGGEDAGKE